MAKTIRELITEKAFLLRDVDSLGGQGAAREVVELTSLLASLNKETIDARMWYNIRKLAILEECKGKVSEANLRAEATEEFRQWQERLLMGKAVEEMVRSLKYYLKNQENEQRL